jgi:hypothetical protein
MSRLKKPTKAFTYQFSSDAGIESYRHILLRLLIAYIFFDWERFCHHLNWGGCIGKTKELVDDPSRVKIPFNVFTYEGFSSPEISNALLSEYHFIEDLR